MLETSAEDVRRRFCTSATTEDIYRTWLHDPRRTEVAPVVMAHRSKLVYELEPGDVREVCTRTEHALGDVRRAEGESVGAIVDWHPNFAFTHTFHVCMEQIGRLPTYQMFRDYALSDALGQKMLGTPAKRKIVEVVSAEMASNRVAHAAMRWRVGNAYYSFLREVYAVVNLRAQGVDLRLHPLADALFRVDAWAGSTALSLRVANKKFREGGVGRKIQTERLLADLNPPLRFSALELKAATKFGVVHLPSGSELERAAARLLVSEASRG